MRKALCILLLLIATAATAGDAAKVRGFWLPANAEVWAGAADRGGAKLTNREGTVRQIPAEILKNVVSVKADLERVSGVRAQLGFVDTETPIAGALEHMGKPTLVISLTWLEQLGRDRDAIAVVLGHELAHIQLGHTKAKRGIESLFATESSSRENELAADELGLRWATEAGFDACGRVRVLTVYRHFREEGSAAHPGRGDRAELAEKYAGRACS